MSLEDLMAELPEDPLICNTPAGGTLTVQHSDEKEYYTSAMRNYMETYKFTDFSDLMDLTRLLAFEVTVNRWQTFINRDKNYLDEELSVVERENYRKAVDSASSSISRLKEQLGMTRAERDAQNETVAGYIAQLRKRAAEFGVLRNAQAVEAHNQLGAILGKVGAFLRASPRERSMMRIEIGGKVETMSDAETILRWINTDVAAAFNEIDEAFRNGQQKYWTETL